MAFLWECSSLSPIWSSCGYISLKFLVHVIIALVVKVSNFLVPYGMFSYLSPPCNRLMRLLGTWQEIFSSWLQDLVGNLNSVLSCTRFPSSDFLVFELEKMILLESYFCTFFCSGTVEVLSYPSLKPLDTLTAHTAGCYCIAIDPKGR